MLKIGDPFPDFSLPVAIPNENGVEQSTLSLSDLQGRRALIFFYPKDATSGCTTQACGLRDEYSAFKKLDVAVVGVSRDTLRSHVRFIENQSLPFPLMSDSEQTLIRTCGLLKNATMYGKPVTKVLRTSFVLDPKGVIIRVHENVTPLDHAAQSLDFLRGRNED